MHNLGTIEAICNEKDRLIVRRARPMAQTPTGVLPVFDRIRDCKRRTKWADTKTIEQLLDPANRVWLIDDVGVMVLCPLSESQGHCHIFFWDRRLRGRESICRAVMHWVKQNTTIETLFTVIGEEYIATIAFARRIGFQETKREDGKIVLALRL